MKKIIKIFKETSLLLNETIVSVFMPLLDVFASIINNLEGTLIHESNTLIKLLKRINVNAKKCSKTSAILYQIFLFIYEIFLFYKIAQGEIEYINLNIIFCKTILILIFSISFIVLMQKNYKNSRYSYIVYSQLLLLMPLIIVYWVSYIEGKTIYLKNLNADQWISIFNTIIIYFSGCFIGLAAMYKAEKEKKTN